MKIINLFLGILCVMAVSCTKEKTDYEAELAENVTEYLEFKEATVLTSNGYTIRVEALNGTFYKGYNEVRVKIDQRDDASIISSLTFLPLLSANGSEATVTCPHRYNLTYDEAGGYYQGYVVFTEASQTATAWELQIGLTADGETNIAQQEIAVVAQTNLNLNMTSFAGNDGEEYIIALVSPQRPQVAENELVAGIYKQVEINADTENELINTGMATLPFTYTEAEGYTLQLDPRMPEPSMGNHSSPNNSDLIQQASGLYAGVVNYTMTGNWTLNFIMLNQQGQIVKGTVVPDDFTPGVEGTKSELYIDILF